MDGVTSIEVYGYANVPAPAGYTVSLKDGVKDADKWTISPNPAEEGSPVTIQYTGRLKVKGVTAVMAAEPSVPDGALSGVFSVSSTKQVNFSKGNLRYASGAWSFFDNQYDYYATYSADAWDKFGWSNSTNNFGMSTSTENAVYQGDLVDWGTVPGIGTGWFTLSNNEWVYLFNTRSASTVNSVADARYAKGKVNGVYGIILFPDTYTHPTGVTLPVGINEVGNAGWNGNNYSAADWTAMETAGCVFLPATGYREGNSVQSAGSSCSYRSSSRNTSTTDMVNYVYFTATTLSVSASNYGRYGQCVRLVKGVKATSDAAPAKTPATVTTAPQAKTDVEAGSTTALIEAGAADGGTLMYAVTTTNTKPTTTDGFSATVPTAKTLTAGTYYVWYYVKADDSHTDSEIAGPVSVTVTSATTTVTWNSSNIGGSYPNGLYVSGTSTSYTKEGITLSANANMNYAEWMDFGEESMNGIVFNADESGGYTFTAPTGKAFTKIEMTLNNSGGWDNASLGSGWAFGEDYMNNIYKVTWTGSAASTVGLLTGAGSFGGETVKSIVFTLVDAE